MVFTGGVGGFGWVCLFGVCLCIWVLVGLAIILLFSLGGVLCIFYCYVLVWGCSCCFFGVWCDGFMIWF